MPLLTEDAYKATMGTPMTLVPVGDVRPMQLGDYVRSISADDFEGHDFSSHDVEKVYRDPGARWIHVLVASRTPNVYLVIVVEEPGQYVYGHYLLDLNRTYGIDKRPEQYAPRTAVLRAPPRPRRRPNGARRRSVAPYSRRSRTRLGGSGLERYRHCRRGCRVPMQVHGQHDDPFFDVDEFDAADEVVAKVHDAERFVSPATSACMSTFSVPSYDADAAALVENRALEFVLVSSVRACPCDWWR